MQYEKDMKYNDRLNKNIFSLEDLVRLVTFGKANSELDITLNVHDVLVFSKLVSISNYIKHLKGIILRRLVQEDNATAQGVTSEMLDGHEHIQPIESRGTVIQNYVCVKDASIFTISPEPKITHYWIGKMDSVDGFCMRLMD